jgi:tRNA uridine 5-carboxymethylaminomethyl modification enzyme
MSSSLPHDVQEKMYRSMAGLHRCRFAKYAYAIEYDCIDPTALLPSLELKGIGGLFSAGQANGSSGYEEAAAQGLIAGINASNSVKGEAPLVLRRDQAYIGVLIDDLVTKGTLEPYRMMTARAEHRIMLRQDNADLRLTEIGYGIGLVKKERYQKMLAKKAGMKKLFDFAAQTLNRVKVKKIFEQNGEPMPERTPSFGDMCRRPEVSREQLKELVEFDMDSQAFEAAVVELKYEGYLKKQESAVSEQKKLESKTLPAKIDYSAIKALRLEARQKLAAIGQAGRISGVSPADIAVLIVYLEKAGGFGRGQR